MAENEKVHSKVMEYVYMGIAIGIGSLLVWDLSTTDDNSSSINDHSKDIATIQNNHFAEVDRSKDVDAKQEEKMKRHSDKLDKLLEMIHKNDKAIGILNK